MKKAEHVEQCLLFDWAERLSGLYPDLRMMFAIPNAGGYVGGFKKNVFRVMAMKREGVKSGVPDICLPVARGVYHGLFIEMKAGKGKASEAQAGWITELTKAGYMARVCTGFEAAKAVIEHYLTIPKMQRA